MVQAQSQVIAVVGTRHNGATVVALGIANFLAERGRTLLIDANPNADASVALAVDEGRGATLARCLSAIPATGSSEVPDISTIGTNLGLLPPGDDLGQVDMCFEDDGDYLPVVLAKAPDYDYVVVDCPTPWDSPFLVALALRSATHVVIPVVPHHATTRRHIPGDVELIRDRCNRGDGTPNILVVANQYDVRTRYGREALAELRQARLSVPVASAVVNYATQINEAIRTGRPFSVSLPATAQTLRDFRHLVEVIVPELAIESHDEGSVGGAVTHSAVVRTRPGRSAAALVPVGVG